VLEALAERYGFEVKFEAFPYGCQYYLKHGVMMPADGCWGRSGTARCRTMFPCGAC
jgi:isocitrate/isopropylmalate dehydrogenase